MVAYRPTLHHTPNPPNHSNGICHVDKQRNGLPIDKANNHRQYDDANQQYMSHSNHLNISKAFIRNQSIKVQPHSLPSILIILTDTPFVIGVVFER